MVQWLALILWFPSGIYLGSLRVLPLLQKVQRHERINHNVMVSWKNLKLSIHLRQTVTFVSVISSFCEGLWFSCDLVSQLLLKHLQRLLARAVGFHRIASSTFYGAEPSCGIQNFSAGTFIIEALLVRQKRLNCCQRPSQDCFRLWRDAS